MSVHTMHPDSHTSGLCDDCPRCAEHAEHPIRTLDRKNLRRIMALALQDDRFASGASHNDLVAAANVLTALERAGSLRATDPEAFDSYMTRWSA